MMDTSLYTDPGMETVSTNVVLKMVPKTKTSGKSNAAYLLFYELSPVDNMNWTVPLNTVLLKFSLEA